MCGLFGVVENLASTYPDRARLRASADLLAHRGPDHSAIYVGPGIGFAHTRLSLVDLADRSNQPMWDASKRYCLLFNGEIYNYQGLRQDLLRAGAVFRTESDTEVLLCGLIEWGTDAALLKLEGMFAFALYDVTTSTVVLARDRFGIKPLFIYDDGDRVLFASEIRAFRPWVSPVADPLSISSYLHGFGGPTNGHTFFQNVRFLGAGSVAEIEVGGRPRYRHVLGVDELWEERRSAALQGARPGDVVDSVDEALNTAVRTQLVADAPVGAFCSGGVDSSLILAIAARSHPDLAIFHANVLGRYSERAAASALAEHLGLELRVVDVDEHQVIELIPEIIDHYSHPYVKTPHSVPFLMVSRLVREHGVKAVLSGEGSDECFLGYGWQASPLPFSPARVRHSLARRFGSWAQSPVHYAGFAPAAHQLAIDLHNRFEVTFETATRRLHAVPEWEDRIERHGRMVTLDALGYNLRALLHRNDAMGMAASIESRFPYLDTRLVRLAVNLPYRMKRRHRWRPWKLGIENKWVLRQVADRYLPPHLSRRRKVPFKVDAVRRIRIKPAFFVGGLVADFFGLSRWHIDHLMQHAPHPFALKLVHLEVWMHLCIEQGMRQDIAKKLSSHLSLQAPRVRTSSFPATGALGVRTLLDECSKRLRAG